MIVTEKFSIDSPGITYSISRKNAVFTFTSETIEKIIEGWMEVQVMAQTKIADEIMDEIAGQWEDIKDEIIVEYKQ